MQVQVGGGGGGRNPTRGRGKTVVENGSHHFKSSGVEGAVFFGIAITEKGAR